MVAVDKKGESGGPSRLGNGIGASRSRRERRTRGQSSSMCTGAARGESLRVSSTAPRARAPLSLHRSGGEGVGSGPAPERAAGGQRGLADRDPARGARGRRMPQH
eukprot:4391740-Prymnesium_polylepis.1